MMRVRLCILSVVLASLAAGQIPITGNFASPDGTATNGSLTVQLSQPSVNYNCSTPAQVLTFSPVKVAITNGIMGALNLYATPCLTQGTASMAGVVMARASGFNSSSILTGTNLSLTAGPGSSAGVIARFTPGLGGTHNVCYFTPVSGNTQRTAQFTFPFNGRQVSVTSSKPLVAGAQYVWSYVCGQPYDVTVSDRSNKLLYTAQWAVPLLNGLGAPKSFRLPNGLILYGLTGSSATVNSIDITLNGGGIGSADMTVLSSHGDPFTLGQTGAVYTLTATNSGSVDSVGTVTVVDTLPAGLTKTALSGTGWSCTLATLTCTRSDVLTAGTSYPAITLTVNVASNAAASITNTVVISGGGETFTANDTWSDVTTTSVGALPDLTLTKTHSGSGFQPGQTGVIFTLTPNNTGAAASSGTITVVDTLPAGLTATAMTGMGWTCNTGTLTCTSSGVIGAGTSTTNPITLTVSIGSTTTGVLVNNAAVSGGGETFTANNTASDSITVGGAPDLTVTKSHGGTTLFDSRGGLFDSQSGLFDGSLSFSQWTAGATYTITVSNAGNLPTGGIVAVTDTLPASLAATAMAGTGWSCILGNLTCTRGDPLAVSASYPPITLTVNVSGTAPSSVTNSVTVSGGGETNTSNDTATDVTAITQVPDLTLTSSHTGNFTQGQVGATYTATVSNVGSASTSGTVTVIDTLPAGLTATALSGTGWTCVVLTATCTRSSVLTVGSSYPAITITVNVASNAAAGVINVVTVSGGGEMNVSNDSVSDFTATGPASDLTISQSEGGAFTQGQSSAYNISVLNSGSIATSGTVTVVDTLPSGLTGTSLTGSGWSCVLGTLTCTRNDSTNAGAGYPAITLAVSVASNAASSVTNSVTVSGGGELNTLNDTSSVVTTVFTTQRPDMTITKTHVGNFAQGQTGAVFTITATNSGSSATTAGVTVTDTLPTGLTATAMTGTGWTCVLGTLTCSRSDALASLASYPAITLTVNVAGSAPATVTNTVTVAGGGETNTSNDTATNVANVSGGSDLTISSTHTGSFTVGQVGATYTLTATNIGASSTSGTVTVVDTLPGLFTATALSGTGWTCVLGTLTCTRSDALATTASYPAITLTLTVAGGGQSTTVVNSVAVSGGSESNTSNDTGTDSTNVLGAPATDNFNLTSLSSVWTFLNPSGGTQSMTGSQVQINVPGGVVANMNNIPDGAPRIVQNTANVDMQMVVKFDSLPTLGNQYEGIVVDQDSTNWLTFHYGSDGASTYISADKIVASTESNVMSTIITIPGGTTSLWLQVTRTGNLWTELWSTDGVTYTTEGSFTQALTVTDVGIFGGNYNNVAVSAPAFVVKADSFISGSTPVPDMTISSAHTGSFSQSQTGAVYSLVATNSGSAPTSGTVTVTDTLPTGLTATAMAGTGWSCTFGTGICTRSDALAAGASYPTITLTVNVSATAAGSVTNSVAVAGGGESNTGNDTATDPTTVNAAGVPISDNFNSGTLNTSLWTFVNPAGGSTSQTGTQLQLVVPSGSNHSSNFAAGTTDNTVRVAQTIGDVNFTVTAKFDSIPTTQFQLEGIIVRQNTQNDYLRLSVESNGSGIQTNLTTMIGGSATQVASGTIAGSPTSIWLQLQRAGNVYTELYSTNGSTYTTVGAATVAYTLNELDLWAGNFNVVPASAPAWTATVDSFTGVAGGGGGGGGAHTNSGPITLTSANNGAVYENVHFTSTNGACITMNGASNVTFHNVEVGPCDSSDTGGNNNGQSFYINGGSGITISDSYLHNNTPCIVNATNCGNYDTGDNILCVNSSGLNVKGSILTYGEAGVEALQGCANMVITGNFFLNQINARNLGNRGGAVQGFDNVFGSTVDNNYILEISTTTNGVTPAYDQYVGDIVNFGSAANSTVRNDSNNVTNNYIQGGNFAFGCGINFDGGANFPSNAATSTISGNTLVDPQACGISIESGFNYVISNNKVWNTSGLGGSVAYQIFQCYNGVGSACPTGQIIPCGNIALSNNLGYSSGVTLTTGGGNPCSNVTGTTNGANGNLYDSGMGAAYTQMNPPATKLPPPLIPPGPVSCVAVSPLSTNTSKTGC